MALTGTISEAVLAPEEERIVRDDYGTKHVWNVTIDTVDGKTIKCPIKRQVKDGKSKSPDGEAVVFEGNRWKIDYQASKNSGGKGPKSEQYEADPKKLASENYRSALHAAITAVDKVGKEVKSENIVALADKFFDAIEAAVERRKV